jgi:hypothetical protein
MSLRDFQRALTSITLDARFANAVHAHGAGALVAYDLSPREARRLTSVTRQPGMALNCTLARANRFASIHSAFPMTCVLLGTDLRGVLDELWSDHLPDNVQLQGEEQPFAALVQGRIENVGVTGLSAYLPAVLEYERACLELACLVRHVARPEMAPRETRWVAFGHDPQVVFAALQAFQQPALHLPRAEHRVRITLIGGELEVTTFEVPAANELTRSGPC